MDLGLSCSDTTKEHQLRSHWKVHDLLSEPLELGSMRRLGVVVTSHLISGTMLDTDVSLGLLISYKEVANVEVPGPLPSTLATIRLKQHGTLVVLTQDVVLERIALRLQEPACPQHGTNDLIRSHHLCFSGAACGHALLATDAGDTALAESEGASGVTPEIRVHRKGRINMPFRNPLPV